MMGSGTYDESPLVDFIKADPWGENPLPYLSGQRWEYVQCDACEQAFHKHILTPDWNDRRFARWMTQEAIAAYERTMHSTERVFEHAVQHVRHVLRLERLTRALRNGGPVRLLDFGCGYGAFLAHCRQFGFEAVGVDRSAARRENNFVNVIYTDLDAVQAAGLNQFHAITLFEVLEHLDDPRAVLEALRTRLLPNGILVLETPDCSGVTTIGNRDDYLKIHPLDHINGFTPESLQRFAERMGFKRIRRPAAHVTTSLARVARSEFKHAVADQRCTQQYFQKC